MTARQANLLAALAVAIADRVHADTAGEAGRGGQTPAALAVLAQDEGLSLDALRTRLGLSQSATVRLVDGLVADRLARRRPGPDGRTRAIVLTRSGRTRARQVLVARREAADEALAVLTGSERIAMESLAETMLAGLVATAVEGGELTCRLCERRACPAWSCPVPRT